ncbi:hypothetical protein, partial [Lutibacter sp.]|uniref:hypothetical protein n=1 Tax=Lutibacter sp. TaxID=1925666 RepID=UPI0025BB1A1B
MNFKSYFLSILSILFVFIFISCSPRINKATTAKKVIYPAAPATPRIQYLTSISSSLDIAKKQSAFTKSIVGENQVLPIYKPYGLFMRNGKLYICDVSLGGGLEIIDFETTKFSYFA